jgi:hypothetical protein
MYVSKLSCKCKRKEKKRKIKIKKTKIKKANKSKKKIKEIYNLYNNLPPRQRRQKLDMIKELMSYPKCRSVEVINNPARPRLNHREVNYINY